MDFETYYRETFIPVEEFSEETNELIRKINLAKQWILEAKYPVVYTGAGISTICGLPDYRGPNGVWTLRNQGKDWQRLDETLHNLDPTPSKSHYILKNLVDRNIIKSVLTTNIDNLHAVSGLVRGVNLFELHGNKTIRECKQCGEGCICPNSKPNIIQFGMTNQEVPSFERHYDEAFIQCCRADLILVLGSSLTVQSACDLPDFVRGRLIIVNKQRTGKDYRADLVIHCSCDLFMTNIA